MLSKVTVIVLSHNHIDYFRQCLESVRLQDYNNIQLIVIDDGSTDGTAEAIQTYLDEYFPHAPFLRFDAPIGNCRAFNRGLKLARGKYIIDLAADDVMLPQRVTKQVQGFTSAPQEVGVMYSNAEYIDHRSRVKKMHFSDKETPPSGNLYALLLARHYICAPTMMIKKMVFDELGGYDPTLAYEDFDFWVRSAIKYKYHYQDEILTQKRNVQGSLGKRFSDRKKAQRMYESTLQVCHKAMLLNKTIEHQLALSQRAKYEMRMAWALGLHDIVDSFFEILRMLHTHDAVDRSIVVLSRRGITGAALYRIKRLFS